MSTDVVGAAIKVRTAAKRAITNHQTAYSRIKENFVKSGDPGKRDVKILELYMEQIKMKWQKLVTDQDAVISLTDDEQKIKTADHDKYENTVQECLEQAMRDLHQEQKDQKNLPNSPSAPPLPTNPWQTQVTQPKKLEHTADYHKFRKWRQSYELYAIQLGLERGTQGDQLNNLLTCMSPEMLALVTTNMGIMAKSVDLTYEAALDIIEKYLRGRRNKLLDLKTFLTLKKNDKTPIDSFMVEFKEAALVADVRNIKVEELEAAVLAMSLEGDPVQQKIFRAEKLMTVDEIWKHVKVEEDAKQTVSSLNEESSSVCAMKKSNYKKGKEKKRFESKDESSKQKSHSDNSKAKPAVKWTRCFRCGREERHMKRDCPARDTKCKKCNEKGHFGTMCEEIQKYRLKQKKSSQAAAVVCGISKQNSVMATLDAGNGIIDKKIFPDTQADITVAGYRTIESLGIFKDKLTPSDVLIKSVHQAKIPCFGYADVTITVKNRSVTERVYVCEGIKGLYLGIEACKKIGIISKDFPEPMAEVAKVEVSKPDSKIMALIRDSESSGKDNGEEITDKLISMYADVFTEEGLPAMKGAEAGKPMEIRIKKDAEPFRVPIPRKIPLAYQAKVKEELDKLINNGTIFPIGDTFTEWLSPMVVTPKPNGGIRICADLTKVNKAVNRTVYPSKSPFEAVTELTAGDKNKYFAKFDARQGYFQMKISEKSKLLTAFTTPWGNYAYNRAPMGFIGTGDAYNARCDTIFGALGEESIAKVVDDIAVAAETLEELVRKVIKVLDACRKHGVTLSPKKCIVGAQSISFVGYDISTNGIEADQGKIMALSEFPVPTSLTDLRSFLGLANQLGQFSTEYKATSTPLRPLLNKDIKFHWTEEHQRAFEATKKALLSPAILKPWNPKAKVELHTDASRTKGIGFALLQRDEHDNRRLNLIQCGSRYVTPTESRYAMVELESLAVFWAIKKCRIYLAGLPHFKVIVDHSCLKQLYNEQTIDQVENKRVANHRTKLTGYNFTVEWKKGKDHSIPDAFSRAPVEQAEQEEELMDDYLPTATIAATCLEIPAEEQDLWITA